MSVARSVLEGVKNAKALIEEKGWVQKTAEDAKGSVCLQNAIAKVAVHDGHPSECSACRVERAVGQTLSPGTSYFNLIAWNDAMGRTKEQVLDVLQRTADRLEAEA